MCNENEKRIEGKKEVLTRVGKIKASTCAKVRWRGENSRWDDGSLAEESQRIVLPAGIHEKRIIYERIYERKKLSLSLSLSSRGCRGEGWATTCARVISIKVAPFATLKSPLSPDCSPMEQRRVRGGRHLLAGVELLPFSPKGPKVEHLKRNVFAGGPRIVARCPPWERKCKLQGFGRKETFLTIRSLTAATGHDDQRRAGRETREGRKEKKKRRAIVGSDDGWTKERESVNKIRMIVKGEDCWRRGKERRLEIRVNEEKGDWGCCFVEKIRYGFLWRI